MMELQKKQFATRQSDPTSFLKHTSSRDPYSFENIKRMITPDGSLDLHQKNINQL